MILNVCEQSGILSLILYVKKIIDLIRIVVPIALILMCTIDFAKMVLNPDEKSSIPQIMKRILAAMLIFFVPTMVNILLEWAGELSFDATDCWNNANASTISTLKAREEAEKKAQEEAAAKAREEQKKKEGEQKAAEEAKKQQTTETSNTLYQENGIDGKAEVINGAFYIPSSYTSGQAGTKGSGPDGFNIYFYNRLKAFFDAAKSKGYKIKSVSAWRSYERQQSLYNNYLNGGGLAAKPGTSNHGWGIAADLDFAGNLNARYWAHDNASKYGLKFPLCKNVRDSSNCLENWHIEPAVLKKK